MNECIRISYENEIIDIPIQKNRTILWTDISAEKFPSAMGLIRYEAHNAVVVSPVNDVLHPPNEEWGNDPYVIMIPNEKGHSWIGIPEEENPKRSIFRLGNASKKRRSSSHWINPNVLELTKNKEGNKAEKLAMCKHPDEDSSPVVKLSWQKFWEKHTEEDWPKQCCFKGCRKKPFSNTGLYKINKHTNDLFTIPACNHCKFNCNEYRPIKKKTKAVKVTIDDMLEFSASNLAELKVYEIKGNTKVKKTSKGTRSDTEIITWKRCTGNEVLPPVCSFEACKKEPKKVAYVNIQDMKKTQLFIILTCGRSGCHSGRSIQWEPVRKGTLAVFTEEDNTEEPNEDRVQEKQSP